MSKFENEQEKKVRDIILEQLDNVIYTRSIRLELLERIMLRIRPFLIDLEFIRDIYSITESDAYWCKDKIYTIQDKIEEYFKRRGDDL